MKLLHAADFHLDHPYAALPPEKAAARRREGRELLHRLARLAAEEQVDLVLLAGDLFDGREVYRETLTMLKEALAAIPAPVLIAPGNHDPYTPRSPYAGAGWPENVFVFSDERVESRELPALHCVVHGTAFTGESLTEDLWDGFRVPEDGRLHIGLTHGDLDRSRSVYHPIAAESVAASGLAYLALGHIHAPSGLRWAGKTAWAYPGCAEGHGFDEPGERGCLLVTVEPEGVRAEFRPLAKRRYLEMEVPLAEGVPPLEAAEGALAACSGEDCVKLILTGERETPPDIGALEEALSHRVFALRCKDRTVPRSGLWDRAEEDTLTGLFLRVMREKAEAGEEGAELAVRFGLAALERGEDCRP